MDKLKRMIDVVELLDEAADHEFGESLNVFVATNGSLHQVLLEDKILLCEEYNPPEDDLSFDEHVFRQIERYADSLRKMVACARVDRSRSDES